MSRCLRGLQVFEVDHPSSQAWKRARLAELGMEIPPTLRYVSIDFECETLTKLMDRSKKNCYSITLSARTRIAGGIVTASATAVFRLSASMKCVGSSTGKSAGCAPLRIASVNPAARL